MRCKETNQIRTKDYELLRIYCKTQEPNAGKQLALKIFINYLKKNTTIRINRKAGTSYGLKHKVEALSRKIQRMYPNYQYEYISNEDFIISMLQNDFDCKNEDYDKVYYQGPNYNFNIKKLKINWIDDVELEKLIIEEFTNKELV